MLQKTTGFWYLSFSTICAMSFPSGISSLGMIASSLASVSFVTRCNANLYGSFIEWSTLVTLPSVIGAYTAVQASFTFSMNLFIISWTSSSFAHLCNSFTVSSRFWWCSSASHGSITPEGTCFVSSSLLDFLVALGMMYWSWPEERATRSAFPKLSSEWCFWCQNLLYITAFQSITNWIAGFRSYCSHCVLEGAELLWRSKGLYWPLHCPAVNYFLGNLQHMQAPKLTNRVTAVTPLGCQSSTCVALSTCNVPSK